MNLLIQNGARVEVQNDRGEAPIHIAASYGNINAIKTLKKSGAPINVQTKNGDSALHFAFQSVPFKVEVVETLAYFGIDMEVKNKKGQSVLACLHHRLGRTNINNTEFDDQLSWYLRSINDNQIQNMIKTCKDLGATK